MAYIWYLSLKFQNLWSINYISSLYIYITDSYITFIKFTRTAVSAFIRLTGSILASSRHSVPLHTSSALNLAMCINIKNALPHILYSVLAGFNHIKPQKK